MPARAHDKALHVDHNTMDKNSEDSGVAVLVDATIPSTSGPSIEPEQIAASAAREERFEFDFLEQVDLLEYIELDDRPTFIVDLSFNDVPHAKVVFRNAALNSSPGLFEILFGLVKTATSLQSDFQQWMLDLEDPGNFQSDIGAKWLWRKLVMRDRWLLVRGSPDFSSFPLAEESSPAISFSAQDTKRRRLNPYPDSRSRRSSENTSSSGISDMSQNWQVRIAAQVKAMTIEAVAAESKFHRMADLIPVGMFIINADGSMQYANEALYAMTGADRNDTSQFPWESIVDETLLPHVRSEWQKLTARVTPTSSEVPLKKKWSLGDLSGFVWVLASAYPEVHPNGSVKWIMGTITDISYQKAAEELLKRKTDEAIEWRSRLERFVDMTSHEIRNPLTAILQCTDEIINTFSALRKSQAMVVQEIPDSVLENSLDAAQTILMCAQHQKRIVQDIGTLSKLDSDMITIVPDKTQPIKQVQDVVRMLQKDMQNSDIQHSLIISESCGDLRVDHLWLDPGRVNQILVNLLTNAIKFTKLESTRRIAVTIEAFLDPPSTFASGVPYPIDEETIEDPTMEPRWGDGGAIFLQISVADTGPGMTESQRDSIFQRFKQASPRTHVKYGGSGLGLFISRKLAELHGGRIGVAGEVGKGSTFAFYVKARRARVETGDA